MAQTGTSTLPRARPEPPAPAGEPTLRDGLRAGAPLLAPLVIIGVSFGFAARSLGWDWYVPVVMSAVVYSGSAQFAAAGVLAAGGAPGAAITAGTLANLRYLPFGVLVARAFRGNALRRALEGQVMVDASIAMATRGGGVSRGILFGTSIPQYAGWVGGTAIGALAGNIDARAWGVDAIFPAFFLAILAGDLRHPSARRVALGGAAIALALTPLLPPGLPVVAAVAAVAIGVRR